MKAAPFSYYDPRTLEEAVAIAAGLDNAKLLAGGQSLMSMLNMRYVMPDHVIDLNRVAGLDQIRIEDEMVHIGAMVRQSALEEHAELRQRAPIFAETLRWVGHIQTRSRGTIGGSLCHLDPAAELPGLAALYDATLHVTGPAGARTVPVSEWGIAYMAPNLGTNEILTGLEFRLWPREHGYAFLEVSRRHGDFAIAGVACLLTLDHAQRISRAAIAIVGVAAAPVRLTEAEQMLVGAAPDEDAFEQAGNLARSLDAISDVHTSSAYRQRLAYTLTKRALRLATARAKGQRHD